MLDVKGININGINMEKLGWKLRNANKRRKKLEVKV